MYKHHREIVDRLREVFINDNNIEAFILIGSVARDDARPESDIDYLLVIDEDYYFQLKQNNSLHDSRNGLCIEPCQQAGGRFITKKYLVELSKEGNEPSRWAFQDAKVLFSRDIKIEELVMEIPVYQLNEQLDKMESFKSQIRMHFSYLELAEYSKNTYLLLETAVKVVLFSGRLILADNKILYPNRKWFMREFKNAPDKPDGIYEDAIDFLNSPSIAKANAYIEKILKYKNYPEPSEGWGKRYERDCLWNEEEKVVSIEGW